eukprot:553678_1
MLSKLKCQPNKRHTLMLIASLAAICIASILLDFIVMSKIDSQPITIAQYNTKNITASVVSMQIETKPKRKPIIRKYNKYARDMRKNIRKPNKTEVRKKRKSKTRDFLRNIFGHGQNMDCNLPGVGDLKEIGRPRRCRFGRRWRPKRNKTKYYYCNITNTPSISHLLTNNNQYNLLNLTINDINKLKQMRLQKPKACNKNRQHSNHLNRQNINLDDENNFVPFINRCKVMNYALQPDLFQYYGHNYTQWAYIHVFKSGGNTVIETWINMARQYRKNYKFRAARKVYLRWWNETINY